MGLRLSEHQSLQIIEETDDLPQEGLVTKLPSHTFELMQTTTSQPFKQYKGSTTYCYRISVIKEVYQINSDYCIGIDWLGQTGRYVFVEPKLNKGAIQSFSEALNNPEDAERLESDTLPEIAFELDFIKLLLEVAKESACTEYINDVVQINWNAPQIPIEQKLDYLTPFLVVQFLEILKRIVRKGLKKQYHQVQENLRNRVKGKKMVGNHIKNNVFKNKLTSTYCAYQVFDSDHLENQFLKKVLSFAASYVDSHPALFLNNYDNIKQSISFCKPAFELITDTKNLEELKHIKHNPFFNDYRHAIEMGSFLLKRFAFNITQTSSKTIKTPPFWIDMPLLFELYVYAQMVQQNLSLKHQIHYQYSTYGNALDILVAHEQYPMIIDAKYKLKYQEGHLHTDIRQVAGYARLNKVRHKLKINDDTQIDCLIIYPDIDNGVSDLSLESIMNNRQAIAAYHKVYKLGIKLPIIQ